MMQTAEQFRATWESHPDTLVRAFTRVLVDFGYHVSPASVQEWITSYYAGEKPRGGPAMFVHGWLQKGID